MLGFDVVPAPTDSKHSTQHRGPRRQISDSCARALGGCGGPERGPSASNGTAVSMHGCDTVFS